MSPVIMDLSQESKQVKDLLMSSSIVAWVWLVVSLGGMHRLKMSRDFQLVRFSLMCCNSIDWDFTFGGILTSVKVMSFRTQFSSPPPSLCSLSRLIVVIPSIFGVLLVCFSFVCSFVIGQFFYCIPFIFIWIIVKFFLLFFQCSKQLMNTGFEY